LKLLLACAFALGVAVPLAASELAKSSPPESRAALDGVVVRHVRDLLADRYDAAWARIHPADRRAVGRELWERCKRSPDGSLQAVTYRGVRVVGERSMTFDSSLHAQVSAVAVTVRVRALLSGVPFDVSDVSHWAVDDGRWARLVEPAKLAAYAGGACPSS
jgi:hypothetical protein